ncbi:MAG TPA: helix-turn-helix domain-containing protein [Candidatus Dormibacteraeota bacterium]
MEAIVRDGLAAVAVEPLAVQLGATKGSFYHHFASRDALIAAALDHWERSQTDLVFARLELIRDPGERLRAVVGAAYADRDGGMRDAALFAAATHPLVKRVVDRVTNRRVRYMTERYVELGLGRARARRRALMVYLAYLGVFDALRLSLVRLTDAELIAYGREVLDILIPDSPD